MGLDSDFICEGPQMTPTEPNGKRLRGLRFRRKDNFDPEQVRFWTDKGLYAQFRERCKSEGLMMQHVFGDFMRWFVSEENLPIERVKRDYSKPFGDLPCHQVKANGGEGGGK